MRCRATVLIPDVLSYCLVTSSEQCAAVTEYLANQRMIPVSIESDKVLSPLMAYDAYHLDFGPVAWTQCLRLHDALVALSEGGEGRRTKRSSSSSSSSNSEESEESGSAPPRGRNNNNNPGMRGGRRRDRERSMVVVVVRMYAPLDVVTNIIAALGIVCVIAGTLRSVDAISALFPYRDVLSQLLYFHDASPFNDLESLFDLTVEDVLRGAIHAVEQFSSDVLLNRRFARAAEHYGTLEEGDLTWIVPSELCAFSCPDDAQPLKSASRYAEIFSTKEKKKKKNKKRRAAPVHPFSTSKKTNHQHQKEDPFDEDDDDEDDDSEEYFVENFFSTVGCVVQLNSARYKRRYLRDVGVQHCKLVFDDGAVPPEAVVERFFSLVDDLKEKGGHANKTAVALHCMAGLGRTGTLACLYLIRHHHFTAREAIAWCRLVRPGSVIGPQQQFVVFHEAVEKAKRMMQRKTKVAEDEENDRGMIHQRDKKKRRGGSSGSSSSASPASSEDDNIRPNQQHQQGRGATSKTASTRSTVQPQLNNSPKKEESESADQGGRAGRNEANPPPLIDRYAAKVPRRHQQIPQQLEENAFDYYTTPASPETNKTTKSSSRPAGSTPPSRYPSRGTGVRGGYKDPVLNTSTEHTPPPPQQQQQPMLHYVVGSSKKESPSKHGATPPLTTTATTISNHSRYGVLPSRSTPTGHQWQKLNSSHHDDDDFFRLSIREEEEEEERAAAKKWKGRSDQLPSYSSRGELGGRDPPSPAGGAAVRRDSGLTGASFAPILSRSSSTASSTATHRHLRVNVTL